MADTQEFLDEVLRGSMWKYNIEHLIQEDSHDRFCEMCKEPANWRCDRANRDLDLYVKKAKEAILQHFQQEEGGLTRGTSPDPLVITKESRDIGVLYTQSQVDRLIREARIDELENLPLQGLIDQCFIAFRRRLDKRFKELSKQEEGNK